MIGYALVGTKHLERAAAFYDEVLGVLGAKRAMQMERLVSWRTGPDDAGFGVCLPYDGQAASVGNGTMIALAASSPEQVKAIYNKAIALGGKDEGAPGARFGTFYAAYFRDLDGNKLNAFCITSE
jgi:catechol 2,3-dioxygenase-like lactoylglutathione lyase family enzyme